ncbi:MULTISPECIES: hypothetical protein [Acidobacterium]|uniref:Lipoprotein n=1 Tax=Acidobacterium capsulatum (strain ATCC 51196 / DSM 11244 / BCRC 80197 / JCM 7670 / NBRC 15755 / NCIMB 13165 / 161) TaxID=240015 RepID=C1F7C5_ACIC5|nr:MULTISPECIES: hypothetical protein [Acidobacterium]ACO34014.1 hypothetical protein ACP_1681 [Acidobacterium capsulatum ATCC 51196]HCT61057.1 hypothetical protein [Acidobacterium sp.]
MKKYLAIPFAAVLLTLASRGAHAQQDAPRTIAGLNDCIGVQYTSNRVLEFVSSCTQKATILFFTDDSGRPMTEYDDPGKVDNTLLSGIKHLTYYACPYPSYYPRNLDGTQIEHPVARYVCRRNF